MDELGGFQTGSATATALIEAMTGFGPVAAPAAVGRRHSDWRDSGRPHFSRVGARGRLPVCAG
ncbi:hypothetical protein [Kribbella sp. NPDC049584]|uniref:hypothetical protein n=1 Tax=Kribbella sp. NPDC049584 TaxID=3154833 RepID=UPI00341C9D73